MKKISLPIDLLVALAQLEDKDVALIMRAIINYASEGVVPNFSNAALRAFFSLFRSNIDEQRLSSERQSAINRENANRKKPTAKKKDSRSSSSSAKSVAETMVAADSTESQEDSDVTDVKTTESISPDVVPTRSESLKLEAIESVYPKRGAFREESLALWNQLSDETRKAAIDFIPYYLKQHPLVTEQLYLNQYLKFEPWKK